MADVENENVGCQHYKRNCRLLAPCCNKVKKQSSDIKQAQASTTCPFNMKSEISDWISIFGKVEKLPWIYSIKTVQKYGYRIMFIMTKL